MKVLHNFIDFIRDSKRMLHILVLIVCMCISMYQLHGCITKLRHPPVTTHYRFAVNETLNYPAITICRNPAYKINILQNYNLGHQNAQIHHTSEWKNFPFGKFTLQEFWDNATYTQSDVVIQYGLHGHSENARVKEAYYFLNGRCFTFLPRVGSPEPWPNSGWAILLKHERSGNVQNVTKPNLGFATESSAEGFHAFIHEVREPWSENLQQTQFITQYLYIEIGEEIEVKISAEEYKGISTKKRPCIQDINYSRYQCMEANRWQNISKLVGCTTPWMRGISGYPHCNNYNQMKQLVNEYLRFEIEEDSGCERSCNSTVYKLFVVKRAAIKKPFSQLYLYYSSKMSTIMQELPGYDNNAFLADLGGSLGFFLGLSVVGVIGVIEKVLRVICCYAKPAQQETKNQLPSDNDKY